MFCQKKWQSYKNGIKTFATENTFQWRRDILEKCPIWPLLVKISCSCEVDMTEGEYICRHGLGLAKSEPSDYFVIITQICSYSIDTVSRKFAILLVFYTHQKSYQVSFLRSTIFNMCFLNGIFPASFQYSLTLNNQFKFCRWLVSKRRPLESEATALPTEPKPLLFKIWVCFAQSCLTYYLLLLNHVHMS